MDYDKLVDLSHKVAKPWKFCTYLLACLLILGGYGHYKIIKELKTGEIIIEQANNAETSNSNVIK